MAAVVRMLGQGERKVEIGTVVGNAVIQMRGNSASDHGDCSRGGEKRSDSKWHFESRASDCKRIWRNPKHIVFISVSVIRV